MTAGLENNQLLRFTTAGSVDDGKSTLIGRLLYDSKSIFEDQVEAAQRTSRQKGLDGMDLALFTDGLRVEREQGITIDVAYRYFTTPKRKFIIADTPGHIQYTRNMVTGASTANAALILVDARKGVVEQTKRHTYIASLLGIPHLIVCVNKMDLVNYSSVVFKEIVDDFKEFAAKMSIKDIRYIPISALEGDNVVQQTENMSWFKGEPLLSTLETLYIGSDVNRLDARFPVQTVIRPQGEVFRDYRGYAGRVASGTFSVGDEVAVLPSGFHSRILSIDSFDGRKDQAIAAESVLLTLEDDVDVSRGDMVVKKGSEPKPTKDLNIILCWLHKESAKPKGKYILKQTSNEVQATIDQVQYKINMGSLEKDHKDDDLKMNDIARVHIKCAQPIVTDLYERNRQTGSVLLIDKTTNETVAGGMVI